jgi:hypothetical protein
MKGTRGIFWVVVGLSLGALPHAYGQSTLDQVEAEGIERIGEGQEAQQAVTALSEAARNLRDEYQSQLKLVNGLETYIGLLNQQLAAQAEEISILERSITDVAVIERQVLPLMLRMIDSLETFIELDVPFLPEERQQRIARLRALMGRSDVTVAEKCRRVFEAYQIENEYGRTIESYTAKLSLDGASFDAEYLRIGRVGLLYRTVGSNEVGFWDTRAGGWVPLENTPWRRLIDQGLKVARQEVAPELIHVPLDPAAVSAAAAEVAAR